MFASFDGCMSRPSKNSKKIMPIFETLLISAGSDTKPVADGPRIIPAAIYVTIIGCRVYRAIVANTAAVVKIKKKENNKGSDSMA